MLNYHLSQKFKLLGRGKFNQYFNISPHLLVGSNSLLIDETQHVKYLIEMRDKWQNQGSKAYALIPY
jgi:hypothetical protein